MTLEKECLFLCSNIRLFHFSKAEKKWQRLLKRVIMQTKNGTEHTELNKILKFTKITLRNILLVTLRNVLK